MSETLIAVKLRDHDTGRQINTKMPGVPRVGDFIYIADRERRWVEAVAWQTDGVKGGGDEWAILDLRMGPPR